jgi:hypothetical protein
MHTLLSNSKAEEIAEAAFTWHFAADDPVGAVSGLRMVIGDLERKGEHPRQRQKKPSPPPPPESSSPPAPVPDSERHVDDYA